MDQLKHLRLEKGLSQAKLAAVADIDPSTVNQIERGAREASPATLRKLAQALDVSLAELLEDKAPKAGSSSLEPSFNDVLAGERREDIFEVVREAVERQNKQDSQAAIRALESARAQTYFKAHDNEVIVHLLRYPPDELAGAVLELMHRCVQLEEALERATQEAAEEVTEST